MFTLFAYLGFVISVIIFTIITFLTVKRIGLI